MSQSGGSIIVEIEDGELCHSGPFQPMTESLLCAHLKAMGLREVPLPPHPLPGTEVVGYVAPDAADRPLNCRVPGGQEPVRGVLIIVGRDGDDHRFLTYEEARVYRMEPGDEDGLPTLTTRGRPRTG